VFVLTSYKDKNAGEVPFPIKSVGANTKAGMKNCAEETRNFARDQDTNPQPQNTRSDPADRIRRFREGIGTTQMPTEEQEAARASEFYRKSLKFLLQCVLSPLYGEKISIVPLSADDLKRGGSSGRWYFVEKILNALDMGMDNVLTLRNRAGKIIGLLSSTGPIPVVDNSFSIPELQIDETKDIGAILRGLDSQDKEILAYWLRENTAASLRNETSSLLYKDLRDKLEQQERIGDSFDFGKIEALIGVEKIEKNNYGYAGFPVLKEYGEAIFCDRITVLPLPKEETPFGYSIEPLRFEADGIPYVFLPPLSSDAIAATSKKDEFVIEKVEIPESIKDPSAPKELRVPIDMEGNKLVSVTIRCELKIRTLRILVRRTYSEGEIRYIKNFPSLTIYGPVPIHGWIAQRNIDLEYPDESSPLKSGSVENITLKDIRFEKIAFEEKGGKSEAVNRKLEFKETTDKYSIYQGSIPLWLAVKTSASTGDTLGGLPLRVLSEAVKEDDWTKAPNFIHTKIPSGRLTVAADIGSSRSAFLFQKSGKTEIEEIFIDNDQPLGIPITTSGTTDVDVNFGMMFFQPEKQLGSVKGKTPIGLLTTDEFQNLKSSEKDAVMLFNSGKLILLDPKSIAGASTRKILSDIKVGDDQKAMYLLAQSLLTLIIDRAVHLECSTVELRVSYLVERYTSFKTAWEKSIKKYKELWPEITVELNMYLPESLAIANELKGTPGGLSSTSGAAIVDIGDYTTDIALFISENKSIKLKDSFSVLFAGRQIILQPIWDYLLFSGAKIESLYNSDLIKSDECIKAVDRLEAAREKQRKEGIKHLSDDVRRDLLCLIPNLNGQNIPLPLRNLFDICYLTEIVILKRILRNEPEGGGAFEIHLFGGGRSHFRTPETGFDWDKTMGRHTKPKKPGQDDGKALAQGLLKKIDEDLQEEAEATRNRAMTFNPAQRDTSRINKAPPPDELRKAYICFLQNAQAVKKWEVQDVNDNPVSTGCLFNVKKSPNRDGEIDNEGLYQDIFNTAVDFALKCKVSDVEVFKTLFAYKVAYDSAVAFYSKA